jgi:hypothetical protein
MENPMKLKLLAPTAVALALAAASFSAGAATISTKLLGEPVQAAADRTIAVNDNTKWVNVTQGETIKFVINGREYTWAFDGIAASFDLSQIIPDSNLPKKVAVYVAPSLDRLGDGD